MSSSKAIVERYYSPRELEVLLGMKRAAVLRLLRPGQIWPVARINAKIIRVPGTAVNAFLEARTWTPKPVAA